MQLHSQTDPNEQSVDSDLTMDAAEFQVALAGFVRAYQFRDRDRICCHDLSVSSYYALDALSTHGAMSLNHLAARLYLNKSSASRLVDDLARKGYVERTDDPTDGRAIVIAATNPGKDLLATIAAELRSGYVRLLAAYPAKVRRAMTELLSSMAAATAGSGTGIQPGRCTIDSEWQLSEAQSCPPPCRPGEWSS